MLHSPRKALSFILLGILAAASTIASEYPERANTEFLVIEDPAVNFELRNFLSRNAKEGIDGAAFTQLDDEIGRPLMESIHFAQVNQHVPVRMFYDYFASFVEGKGKKMPAVNWIGDPSLARPGEVLTAHPLDKIGTGLSISDYVHGKSYRVDGFFFIGGYNNTSHSLRTVDSGFVMRAIDPTKPFLGTDITANYDEIFGILQNLKTQSRIPSPVRTGANPLTGEAQSLLHTPEQRAQFAEILEILSHPARPDDALKDYQFRPKRLQLRTNDLFKHLTTSEPTPRFSRYEFPNDNHSHLAEEFLAMEGKGSVDFWSYVYAPTPEVHEAIIQYVREGGTLNLWTNGQNSHRTVTYGGVSVYYSLESIVDLLDETEGGKGKVNVLLLDGNRAKLSGMGPYLHRKRMVFSTPDREWVEEGSDNFTWSSGKKNDELLISIEDERYARQILKRAETERPLYDSVTHAELRAMFAKRPFAYRCIRAFLKKIF